MDLAQRIGARIRDHREARGLTLDALSIRSGVRSERISRVERGKVEATLGTLDKLARGLGMQIGDLLSDTDSDAGSLGALPPDLQEIVVLLERKPEPTIRAARSLVQVLVEREEELLGKG